MNIPRTALVVVDAQQGFTSYCPDELPVPGAHLLAIPINRLLAAPWAHIAATKDYHPADHCSFLGHGGTYPPHCVVGTKGERFLPGLKVSRIQSIWHKGYRPCVEAHSPASVVNNPGPWPMADQPGFIPCLKAQADTVVLCGIATNICVAATARDLRAAGLEVVIAEDACAAIDLPGFEPAKVRAELEALGVRYLPCADILG